MSRKLFSIIGASIALMVSSIALQYSKPTHAAEIKVFSSPGIIGAVNGLARQFEGATGHKVVVEFDVIAVLKRRISVGEIVDVVILSPANIKELAQAGNIDLNTRATFGRTGMGIAVRKGGPRPDMSSPEAFRRVMLNAKSVAYARDGSSGKLFLAALDRLGIAEEMKPKVKAVVSPTIKAVIDGDTEFAFTGVGQILADAAVDLVGGLPHELQTYVVFTLGATSTTKEPEAAEMLIKFFTGPSASPVLKSYGVEPGAQ